MPKIIQLDPHLANLIAAGEVVERPASVVKELVENAVDAGAKTVTVELQNGGMSFLRVSDDGCGMGREDAKTAFLRHATSKLRTKEDLGAIGTLGFRGEALAATAAVSRIDLLTRTAEDLEGSHLTLEAGKLLSCEAAGCPVGTTIVVRDLFYNTPARMKFMKRDTVEASAAADAVRKQALAHPEISFRFLKDGELQLRTPGDGDLLAAIYAVLGRQAAQEMIPVDSRWEQLGVTGFVSRPTATRGSRNSQIFFVNHRYIRSRTMTAALEEAYRNQLMTGRFPSCVLNLTMPLSAVDVNVHPAKTEVKFLNEKEIFDCVHYGVLGALNKAPGQVPFVMQDARCKTQNEASGILRDSEEFMHQASGDGGCEASGNRQQATGDGGCEASGIRHQASGDVGCEATGNRQQASGDGGCEASGILRDSEEFRQQATGDGESGFFASLRMTESEAGSAVGGGALDAPQVPTRDASPVNGHRSQEKPPLLAGEGDRPQGRWRGASDDRPAPIDDNRFFKAMSAEEYRGKAKPQVHTLTRWEYEQMTKALNKGPAPVPSQALREAVKAGTLNSSVQTPLDEPLPSEEPLPLEESPSSDIQFRYVGEVFRTYILVEQGDELILIDKHAAHERINFERLLAQGTAVLGQTLLQPRSCRFEREEAALLTEHRNLLLSLGYDLDDLGEGDLLLRQIPSDIRESDAAATLSEIAEHLRDGRLDTPQRLRDEALHTIACKAAIKAGYITDPAELRKLAETVLTNPDLKYCPHGRPICTVISKKQIEKQFKRIT